MVRIIAFAAYCLLPYVIWASSLPRQTTNNTKLLDLSVEDILNSPAILGVPNNVAPKPNITVVDAVPDSLTSAVSSVLSVAATATATGGVSTATPGPTTPRDLSERSVPPAPLNFGNINCKFNPSFPLLTAPQWIAAITRACRVWFDNTGPPFNNPTQWAYEGQVVPLTLGPPAHQFHFVYHVRTVPCVLFDSWHRYSANQCISELVSYMNKAFDPPPSGVIPGLNAFCFDTSGFDTSPDLNAPIWFEVTSPSS